MYVLWLQRWRRGWSRSLPAVDAKWLAGARDENRMDMIDRRRPRPWTHAEEHEIINQDLLIIGERCVLLAGYRGVEARLPVCPLSAAATFKTQGRVRRVMVPDKADSYQTIAPKQLLRLGYMPFLPPKPVPGVARTIKMASIDGQCGIVGGG